MLRAEKQEGRRFSGKYVEIKQSYFAVSGIVLTSDGNNDDERQEDSRTIIEALRDSLELGDQRENWGNWLGNQKGMIWGRKGVESGNLKGKKVGK